MAIRMEKDPQRDRNNNDQSNRNNSGGGSSLFRQILPFLALFIFKKPKLLIPILIIGGIWYFFFYDSGSSFANDGEPINSDFTFGATFDEKKYDEAQVFEPLSAYGNNLIPKSTSLLKYAPKRMHQGAQGSCVGWSSSYAAKTILKARASGQNPNSIAYSPSFLYNQIALPNCQGAYMKDAMQTMHQVGGLPYSKFGYDPRSCRKSPSSSQRAQASQHRIKGYTRLTKGGRNYSPDLNAIRQHLAQGAPVVIGMEVGGTFMHQMRGKNVWQPTQRDYRKGGYSGHAMCVTGYDDTKYGGSFEIMNSWGPDWGNNGVAWVTYQDFNHFVKEAYGLYPEGETKKYDPNKLGVKFGLLDNASSQLLPIREVGNRLFRTTSPIRKGDKFKIAVTNTVECYIYVFGEEANGQSTVLFPYTQQHSAYCGITGTRVFPKDYSMTADDVGNRDRIAVIVSKAELNYNTLNDLINSSRQRDYVAKVRDAIITEEVQNVNFESGEAIEFLTNLNGKNAVGVVIEIDKR